MKTSMKTTEMLTDKPEISIIVPVYKVETYLRECLDSIKAQTFTDWECILVDDGSPDRCGEICEEYASADPRFRVIHRENGGVSAARNSGLAISRGRYVGFVDSDDVAFPGLFERLHELITSFDVDVAQVCYESRFTGSTRSKHLVDKITVLDRREVVRRLVTGKSMPNYLWIKLFKREVIDTPFPEGVNFEDIYVMAYWAKNIHSMVLAPDVLYSYRKYGKSISNSSFAKNRIDYLNVRFKVCEVFKGVEPEVMTHSLVHRYLWRTLISAGKDVSRFERNPEIREKTLEQIAGMGQSMDKPEINILGFKKWFRATMLRRSPLGFGRLMRWVYKIDFHGRYYRSKQF